MSFVLRREAKVSGPGSAPDSPKLWRPSGEKASTIPQKPASPQKPEPTRDPAARSTEDLFKFYETMSNTTGPDLSLKDIVERTKKPSRRGNLKPLKERIDQEGGGNQQQQHQHRHELLHPKAKVVVPPKANGEKNQYGRGNRKPFGDYFENHEQPKNAADSAAHEAVRRRTPVASPRASPRRTFHEAMSTPESSPLRSTSVRPSSRMPPGSPMRSPRPYLESSDPSTWLNPNYGPAFRSSPLRSPGPSLMASPNRRGSPLASASYPSQVRHPPFGDPEPGRSPGRRRETANEWKASTEHWMQPPSSPLRSNYVGASPLGEAPKRSTGDEEPQQHVLGDLLKAKPTNSAPPFRKPHPSKHCSTCSSFTLFKTRCLVCGNIYCRNCVKDAMGDMPEGRKCKQTCLGKPFHSRYIRNAGNSCFFFVPSSASAAELKWARRRHPTESVSHGSRSRTEFSNTATSRSSQTMTPTSTSHMMLNRSRSAHPHRTPTWTTVS